MFCGIRKIAESPIHCDKKSLKRCMSVLLGPPHSWLQVSGVYCTAAAPCLAPCAIKEGGAGCAPVCISANRRPRCRICKETSMNQTDLPIYCDSVLWPHLACSREVTAVAPKILRSASCKFQHRGSSFTNM